jgi:predicted ATPase
MNWHPSSIFSLMIASYSPMLMAFPGAQILNLDQNPIRELPWKEVEHVRLMKHFFQNPQRYFQRLFSS